MTPPVLPIQRRIDQLQVVLVLLVLLCLVLMERCHPSTRPVPFVAAGDSDA